MELKDIVVFDENGLNVEASVEKFRNIITAAKSQEDNYNTIITKAIHGAFDQYKGQFITMSVLISLAVGSMGNIPAKTVKIVGDKIRAYIKANSVPNPDKPATFYVKGTRGIARVCDMTPVAALPAAPVKRGRPKKVVSE